MNRKDRKGYGSDMKFADKKAFFTICKVTIAVLATMLLLRVTEKPVYATENFDKYADGVTQISTGGIADPTGAGEWSYVYYGTYNGNVMKYRVLDPDTTDFGEDVHSMLLDCNDCIIQYQRFDSADNNDWESCAAKTLLNGDGFLNKEGVFTDPERAVIIESSKDVDNTVSQENMLLTDLNETKIFLLDISEVTNADYGYGSDESRKKRKSDGGGTWWLRSPMFQENKKAGAIDANGQLQLYSTTGVYQLSPAFNLDLSKIIFTSVVDADNDIFKLTILDPDLNVEFLKDNSGNDMVDNWSNTVTFTCEVPDGATGLSVLITEDAYTPGVSDPSKMKYYGAVELAESYYGTAKKGSFVLPEGYDPDTDHVYILAEMSSEDHRLTDYAGLPCELTIPPTKYKMEKAACEGGRISSSDSWGFTGDQITITAEPEEGYRFKNWEIVSGDATIDNVEEWNTELHIGNTDVVLKAVFEEIQYRVSCINSWLCTISPESGPAGTAVTLTFRDDQGQRFQYWEVVSGGVTLANDKAAQTTFVLGTEDVVVDVKAVQKYSINISQIYTGHGSFSASPNPAILGETVTLTGRIDDGSRFKYWVVGGRKITDLTTTFVMGEDGISIAGHTVNVEAYVNSVYPLSVTTDGHGSAQAAETDVFASIPIDISATPDEGYAFDKWVYEGDYAGNGSFGDEDEANTTFKAGTRKARHRIKATFTEKEAREKYEVAVTTDGNGSVNAALASAAKGDEVAITATPEKGYTFQKWVVESGKANIRDIYSSKTTFVMGRGDVTLKAVFVTSADFYITPTSIDFGSCYSANIQPRVVTIRNFGTVPLTFESLPHSDAFTISDFPQEPIPVNGSATFTVKPSRMKRGDFNERLIFKSEQSTSAILKVHFEYAVDPVYELTADPAEIDFGNVNLTAGESFEPITVTLKNTGSAFILLGSDIHLENKDGVYLSRYNRSNDFSIGEIENVIGSGEEISFVIEPKAAVSDKKIDQVLVLDEQNQNYQLRIPLHAQFSSQPDGLWMKDIPDQNYTGNAIKPETEVYFGSEKLREQIDYTVSYANNTKAQDAEAVNNAGKSIAPTVTVKGKDNYAGTITKTFTIKALPIGRASHAMDMLVLQNRDVAHLTLTDTGKDQKLNIALTYAIPGGKTVKLKQGTDFTLDRSTVKDAKDDPYVITVTGCGNFTGTRQVKVAVLSEGKKPIEKVVIPAIPAQMWCGSAYVLEDDTDPDTVRVTDSKGKAFNFELKDKARKEKPLLGYGKDYTLLYSANSEVGTATVTVIGLGDYAGAVQKTFKINGTALSKMKMENFNSKYDYTGNAIQQEMKFYFTVGKGADQRIVYLAEGRDYRADYSNNTEIGTATVIYTGMGGYTGSVKKTFTISGRDMKKIEVKDLSLTTNPSNPASCRYDYVSKGFLFTGLTLEPAGPENNPANSLEDNEEDYGITLTDTKNANYQLVKGTDYTVSYANNTAVGSNATVIFKGIGQYTGEIRKRFKIIPCEIDTLYITMFSREACGEGDEWNNATLQYEYYKSGVKPQLYLKNTKTGLVLKEGTDYTVKLSNNTKPARFNDSTNGKSTAPTIEISGKGNYKGKRFAKFTIIAGKPASGQGTLIYQAKAGNLKNLKLVVRDSMGMIMKEGTDYYPLTDAEHTKYLYKGRLFNPDENITSGDAVVEFADNEEIRREHVNNCVFPAGTKIGVQVTGKGDNYGDVCLIDDIVICYADLSSATVTIPPQMYTGKEIKPFKTDANNIKVSVKVGKSPVDLVCDRDYEVESYSENTAVGTAKVVIKGKTGYIGEKIATFKITPKQMNYTIHYDANREGLDAVLSENGLDPENYQITGTMKDSVLPAGGALSANGFKLQKKVTNKWVNVPVTEISFGGWKTVETDRVIADKGAFKPSWLERILYGKDYTLQAQWIIQ